MPWFRFRTPCEYTRAERDREAETERPATSSEGELIRLPLLSRTYTSETSPVTEERSLSALTALMFRPNVKGIYITPLCEQLKGDLFVLRRSAVKA